MNTFEFETPALIKTNQFFKLCKITSIISVKYQEIALKNPVTCDDDNESSFLLLFRRKLLVLQLVFKIL